MRVSNSPYLWYVCGVGVGVNVGSEEWLVVLKRGDRRAHRHVLAAAQMHTTHIHTHLLLTFLTRPLLLVLVLVLVLAAVASVLTPPPPP